MITPMLISSNAVAGLPIDRAFDMSLVFLGLGIFTTCLSWVLFSKVGRRRTYNFGLATLSLMMFIIGILDCIPKNSSTRSIIWAQSIIMVSRLLLHHRLCADIELNR